MVGVIAWVLTVVSLTGNMMNCMRLRACFVIWTVCNLGWTIIDMQSRVYSRAILDSVQICFSVYGFIKWGKIDEEIGIL